MSGGSVCVIRRSLLRLMATTPAAPLVAGLAFPRLARAAFPPVAVWKDPNCGCCEGWVRHMRTAGFSVTVRDSSDLTVVKKARGVPDDLWSCHTAVIDGYVIEGHVPAPDIVRLLAERPEGKGLAVPGMPASAPGMDQPGQPYSVMLFGSFKGPRLFADHPA